MTAPRSRPARPETPRDARSTAALATAAHRKARRTMGGASGQQPSLSTTPRPGRLVLAERQAHDRHGGCTAVVRRPRQSLLAGNGMLRSALLSVHMLGVVTWIGAGFFCG